MLIWLGSREYRQISTELNNLYSLPEPEAKKWALRLIEEGLFQCKSASSVIKKSSIPDGAFEILDRFDEISRNEFWIARNALSDKASIDGFVKIGGDAGFEEILVRAGSNEVYLSYGPKHGKKPLEEIPSLWHLLIIASGVDLNEQV